MAEFDDKIKYFIEKNIDFINENKWEELYMALSYCFGSDSYVGKFTQMLISCDINPLNYLKVVPKAFWIYDDNILIDIPKNVKEIKSLAFISPIIEKVNLYNYVNLNNKSFPPYTTINIAEPIAYEDIINIHRKCVENRWKFTFRDCLDFTYTFDPISLSYRVRTAKEEFIVPKLGETFFMERKNENYFTF